MYGVFVNTIIPGQRASALSRHDQHLTFGGGSRLSHRRTASRRRLHKADQARGSGSVPLHDASAPTDPARSHQWLPTSATETEVHLAGRILLLRRQGKLASPPCRTGRQHPALRTPASSASGAPRLRRPRPRRLGRRRRHRDDTRRASCRSRSPSFELLSKALRPLPDKWKGLTDVDTRYRQRYVDLIVNEDTRRVFDGPHRRRSPRSARTCASRGYLEVETPVLDTTRAAPRRGRSSPTTTRSTSTSTCASRSSCPSSA